ncbi:MAG: type I-E CRISPR-associated endonuclease Cas1 [Propionibacterium sp.]|nr:type I-E CRISPR-associated endonuclease Cas1 [Propionibacterium sp.]
MDDLHKLPRFQDSLSFVYLEQGRIDQHEKAIAFHDKGGVTPIPVASTTVLLLGPGTRITHAAMRTIAENNALVEWVGEHAVRCYAAGMGGTRSSSALLHQAALACDPKRRIEVVRRMYRLRFKEDVDPALTIQQLRGKEGARVRSCYAQMSKVTRVPWSRRSYDRGNWDAADPVNQALSVANSCLYGVCHAAILSLGYSPAIGFIHTGKQLSFVYDVADFYKTELTIPMAFYAAKLGIRDLGRSTRLLCRDAFRKTRLLKRIVPDIREALGKSAEGDTEFEVDYDPALPTELWEPPDGPDGGEQGIGDPLPEASRSESEG